MQHFTAPLVCVHDFTRCKTRRRTRDRVSGGSDCVVCAKVSYGARPWWATRVVPSSEPLDEAEAVGRAARGRVTMSVWCVKEQDGAVVDVEELGRAADEARSARQHRHRVDPVGVHVDGALARAVAPQLDGPVVRAGDDAAVGRRRHAPHRICVPSERHDLARELPHPERAARGDADLARRRNARDVVREREADHDVLHHVRRQIGRSVAGSMLRDLARDETEAPVDVNMAGGLAGLSAGPRAVWSSAAGGHDAPQRHSRPGLLVLPMVFQRTGLLTGSALLCSRGS